MKQFGHSECRSRLDIDYGSLLFGEIDCAVDVLGGEERDFQLSLPEEIRERNVSVIVMT
jgi:hypothetical protein